MQPDPSTTSTGVDLGYAKMAMNYGPKVIGQIKKSNSDMVADYMTRVT